MSIAQVSNDLLLERITYRVPHEAPAPIPWPDGLAPRGVPYGRAADQPLPRADVVVVPLALADVADPPRAIATWAVIANLN